MAPVHQIPSRGSSLSSRIFQQSLQTFELVYCSRSLAAASPDSSRLGQPTGGSCGFTFVEGEEYIVYGHDSNYADGGYTVGICSRTALLGQAQADIDALGEGNAPQAGTGGPAPEEPQDTALPSTGGYSPPVWATALVVGIGAALAAGGVGLMVHSRRLSRRRMDAVS